MPQVAIGVAVFVAVLAWWACGSLLALPIALAAARWGLLVGAALGLAATLFLYAGLIGRARVSSPERATKMIVPDDPRPAPLDFAWPSYLLLQCWYDLAENLRLTKMGIHEAWRRAWQLVPRVSLSPERLVKGEEPVRRRTRVPTIAMGWPLLTVPAAFLSGATVGACVAALLVAVTVFLVVLAAQAVLLSCLGVMVVWARLARRRRRSAACCTACNHVAELPAYRCPGAHEDKLLHRRLRPGLSGLWWRRCGCGVLLPTTPARVVGTMSAWCPRCAEPLHPAAGYATEARVVAFGAARVGKSDLLEAATRASGAEVLEPARSGVITLRFPGRRPHIVHLFHPAGADVMDPERRRDLHFLERASSLVYVLDPLSIPGLRKAVELHEGAPLPAATIATDDPTETYNAVLSALRSFGSGVPADRLAVVVTKRDRIEPIDERIGPRMSSSEVRDWIEDQGAGGITWSAKHDFRRHRYFFVCTRDPAEAHEPLHWLLRGERIHTGRAAVEPS